MGFEYKWVNFGLTFFKGIVEKRSLLTTANLCKHHKLISQPWRERLYFLESALALQSSPCLYDLWIELLSLGDPPVDLWRLLVSSWSPQQPPVVNMDHASDPPQTECFVLLLQFHSADQWNKNTLTLMLTCTKLPWRQQPNVSFFIIKFSSLSSYTSKLQQINSLIRHHSFQKPLNQNAYSKHPHSRQFPWLWM
jgi:hypothetical protein